MSEGMRRLWPTASSTVAGQPSRITEVAVVSRLKGPIRLNGGGALASGPVFQPGMPYVVVGDGNGESCVSKDADV